MAEIVLNYEKLINAIKIELDNVLFALKGLEGEDNQAIVEQVSYIKDIEVSDEQTFLKKQKTNALLKGTVYVVVKFTSGSTNYATSFSPVSLLCIGTPNKVRPVQLLLSVFAATWTTLNLLQGLIDEHGDSIEMEYASQVWNTPEIVTNFNEMDASFKNLYKVTGGIITGNNSVKLGELTYVFGSDENDKETIKFMQVNSEYRASPSPQPFGNTFGFTVTELNFSSDTLSISTYLLDTQLIADAFSVKGFSQTEQGGRTSSKKPNDKFEIIITYTNGFSNQNSDEFFRNWKLVGFSIENPIGDISKATLVFTH